MKKINGYWGSLTYFPTLFTQTEGVKESSIHTHTYKHHIPGIGRLASGPYTPEWGNNDHMLLLSVAVYSLYICKN